MAKIWTTGPAHFFVGVGGTPLSRSILYFGTCRQKPSIDEIFAYSPVMNDLGGQVHPFERIDQGVEAVISGTFNRFNYDTWRRMKSSDFQLPLEGARFSNDTGTAMGQEGRTFPVYVLFPYSSTGITPRASMAGLVPGYRFWSCILMPTNDVPGTDDENVTISWQATRAYTSSGSPLTGSMIGGSPGPLSGTSLAPILYDSEMGGLPAID